MNNIYFFLIVLLVTLSSTDAFAAGQRRTRVKSRTRVHRSATNSKQGSPKVTVETETPVEIPTATVAIHEESNAVAQKVSGPCPACADMRGKCSVCKGSKKKMKVTVEHGTQYLPCDQCGGTGICPECHGTVYVTTDSPRKNSKSASKSSSTPSTLVVSFQDNILGITYQDIDGKKLSKNEHGGIYVTRVDDNSAAAEYGIRKGDIIEKLNNTTISSHSDMQKALSEIEANDVAYVRLWRNATSIYVAVPCHGKAVNTKSTAAASSTITKPTQSKTSSKPTVQFPFKVRITTVDKVVIDAIAYGIDETTVYYRKQSDPEGQMHRIQKNQVIGFDF